MAQAQIEVEPTGGGPAKSVLFKEQNQTWIKLPLAALVLVAMIAGIWSALLRLGWSLPASLPSMAGLHGPLMIGGVLGTLIGLERAVAVSALASRRLHWSFIAPLAAGLSAILLLVGATTIAQILALTAAATLVAVYAGLLRLHISAYMVVMGFGAAAWLVGNLLWIGGLPSFVTVHWWMAFLVLTVVGERLELARMTRLTARRRNLFLAATATYLLGLLIAVQDLAWGVRLAGAGQLLLALWLARYDIARRTVRLSGAARYMALCLLSGYVWLGVGGTLGIAYGAVYAGFAYDALLHAVLFGFVFSMIFGHAPIIVPALTGLKVRVLPRFYGPLLALHVTLLIRQMGNWSANADMRMWGGLLNAAVILYFGLIMLSALHRQSRDESPL